MNLNLSVSKIIVLSFFSLFLLSCGGKDLEAECEAVVVRPTVVQDVEPVNAFTPVNVANLTRIAIALERYKQEHRSYPTSSTSTKSWDHVLAGSSSEDSKWLEMLVPKYIDVIPLVVNEPNPPHYAYRSDGANYKLLALKPSDCELVKSKQPALIDPRRDCKAYGFWTARAKKW